MEPIRIVCLIMAVRLNKDGTLLTTMSAQSGANIKIEHVHANCPACEGRTLRRLARVGIFERRVFSAFGYYPWKCSRCGARFLLKKRGLAIHRDRPQGTDEVIA